MKGTRKGPTGVRWPAPFARTDHSTAYSIVSVPVSFADVRHRPLKLTTGTNPSSYRAADPPGRRRVELERACELQTPVGSQFHRYRPGRIVVDPALSHLVSVLFPIRRLDGPESLDAASANGASTSIPRLIGNLLATRER